MNSRISTGIVFFLMLTLQGFYGMVSAQTLPKTYVANKLVESITIDGRADEADWENARWTDNFIDIEGEKTPKYHTRMKMAWNDVYLYFYVEIEEPNVWGTLKQRDTVIFYNNDFEIFLDPDGDTHNYMEFEINVLNTVWDLWLTKPYRNGAEVINGWDIQGLKTAVSINGTLNDPTDVDKGWNVEVAMPWKALLEASKKKEIPANEFWRINFSRVNWNFELIDGHYSRKKDENGKYLREYNWVWSPQGVINMHEPEHWGYVYFSDSLSNEEIGFEIPKDDHLKWYLYEMARKIWATEKASKNQNQIDFDTVIVEKEILGKTVTPQFERHSSGWNIWIQSPFSRKKLVVRQDGQYTNEGQ